MIHVTEKAAAEVKRIIADEELPEDTYLRLGIRGGGCAGLSYTLGFVDAPEEGDLIHEEHGARVVIDAKSVPFLEGVELDFKDGLLERGFVFSNPNARRSCGCGTSFSAHSRGDDPGANAGRGAPCSCTRNV